MTAARKYYRGPPRAQLAALAACLRDGDLAERTRLAETLERAAIDIVGPGRRFWATVESLNRRDVLLRRAATKFFAGYSMAGQARQLHTELSRYHSTGWQRERSLDACPPRHRGRLGELLWAALRQNDRPLSERALRRLLSPGYSWPATAAMLALASQGSNDDGKGSNE